MSGKGRKAVALVMVVCVLGVGIADIGYRAEHKKKYTEKAEQMEEFLEMEKKWIRENQGEEGEIYMNVSTESSYKGRVNPYFSCLAARGLLTGNAASEDLQCVAAYLNWHVKELLESGGEICDYDNVGGIVKPGGKADSVDSYLAVFLTLVSQYVQKGGELSLVPQCAEAVALALGTLQTLTRDGLTQVSPENGVCYLMDNLEVCEAYRNLGVLLSSGDAVVESWEGKEEGMRYVKEAEKACRKSIEEKLWNGEEKRYETGLGESGRILTFQGWEQLYPDAAAQVFPTACGFEEEKKGREVQLYRTLCRYQEWEMMKLADEFDWPVFSYIAVLLKDTQKAEIYLENYQEKYSKSRAYPLYTADAAWAARAYGTLADNYRKEAKTGLLDLLWKEGTETRYEEK